MAHHILIKGGTVVDGTGAPGRPLDIAIDGHKIAGMYKRSEAKAALTVDATDKIVCPGFVDIHSHSELMLLCNPLAESKIRQGVTTELVGNCGMSPAPAIGEAKDALASLAEPLDVEVDWVTLDEYLLRLSNLRASVNVATLVGAGTLRQAVVGNRDVKVNGEQLAQMKALLGDAMLQGAFGLSSGLIYAPGCYSTTEELTSLASTASSLGGIYTSHIRGEGRTLVAAVEEAISIGRDAPIRVQISHHKACGRNSWGLVNKTIGMIEDARREGVDVAFDVYPYTASCTSLETILPPWAREGTSEEILARLSNPETRASIVKEFKAPSYYWEDTVAETGWENINVIGLRTDAYRRFENKSIAQIALETGIPPEDIALDIIADEKLRPYAVFHEILEDDVMTVIRNPLAAIGSDGEAESPYGPTGKHATHPRAYGTFPRALRRFVYEKGLVPVEEMIRKMTSWPAERIGLADRGVLAKGMAADIVVFDPAKITDMATFDNSHVYSVGVEHVLVNGAVTISDGEHTKERAGHVLRHAPSVA